MARTLTPASFDRVDGVCTQIGVPGSTTTTTIPVAALQAAAQTEIDRACAEANFYSKDPTINYDASWGPVISQDQAQQRAQACHDKHLADEAAARMSTVLLADSGNGDHTTTSFTVTGNWDLIWSYDCTGTYFGTGNFIVYIDTDGDKFTNQPLNLLGAGDHNIEHYHTGGSTIFLEVLTSCRWSLKAHPA